MSCHTWNFVVPVLLLVSAPVVLSSGTSKQPKFYPNRSTIVHLFEWRFDDIADECETFLGPNGYGGVQTSPITEHAIIDAPHPRPWYERYQPVSYIIKSRSGDEKTFRDMVHRCNKAHVRVYVDVVMNHMTGPLKTTVGTDNTTFNYEEMYYPGVPYSSEDFHQKRDCPTQSGNVEDYRMREQVFKCQLMGMRDLNHSNHHVRGKLVNFLNHIIGMGVAGFRIDAAGYMNPKDLGLLFDELHSLNSSYFPARSKPFAYMAVTNLGPGSAVTEWDYKHLGRVTQYGYAAYLGIMVTKKWFQLSDFKTFAPHLDLVPSKDAVVFVESYLTQRGATQWGLDTASFRDKRSLVIATAFMLAHPHGLPVIMSSYRWERRSTELGDINAHQGPPSTKSGAIRHVLRLVNGSCGNGWVCEHRWPLIQRMVEFRNTAGDEPLVHWWDNGADAVAFGRGSRAFIIISNEENLTEVSVQTGMEPGVYCNIMWSDPQDEDGFCSGHEVVVRSDRVVHTRIEEWLPVPIVAIHVNTKQAMI